eukprot:5636818-Amphidinium_carterae.1
MLITRDAPFRDGPQQVESYFMEGRLWRTVKASSGGVGMRALVKELGMGDLPVKVCRDSAAARSMVMRRGNGKIKHLQTRQLHVQLKVQEGGALVDNIAGVDSRADVLTNAIDGQILAWHMKKVLQRSSVLGCLTLCACMRVVSAQESDSPLRQVSATAVWMARFIMLLSAVVWRLFRISRKDGPDEEQNLTVEVKCEERGSGSTFKEGQKQKNLFVSATGRVTGECYHTSSRCDGLRSAIRVRTLRPCRLCSRGSSWMTI